MKFKEVKNVVMVDFSDYIEDFSSDERIALHTANTWQTNRTFKDKTKDTQLGKLAEHIVEQSFDFYGVKNYITYDSFRLDSFELHAPFDGVFYHGDMEDIARIVYEDLKVYGAKLSANTRNLLREKGVKTVEIKSTRISQKYKDKVGFKDYKESESIDKLISYLNSLDYIMYPFYKREGSYNYTYGDYCNYIKYRLKLDYNGKELAEEVKKIELENATDIYLRVFIDEIEKIAIVMGYITREKLLENPEIKKLIQIGKSERTIYFARRITDGFHIKFLKNN